MAEKTIRMVRDAEQFPAPHSADVHPAEVDNYKTAGWTTEIDPLDHDANGKRGGVRKPKAAD